MHKPMFPTKASKIFSFIHEIDRNKVLYRFDNTFNVQQPTALNRKLSVIKTALALTLT